MILYNLGIYLYKFAIFIASLFRPNIAGMRSGEARAVQEINKIRKPGERWVWLHAASLGEFEQGRPILERIRRSHPEYKLLLTFFSPSGYEVRHNYPGVDLVTYLPLDTPRASRAFLDALQPEIVYIVKYEFWLNYLNALRERHIPTYLVSAIFRLSQPFFRWYGAIFRDGLAAFRTIYVQNEPSRELLASIGVNNVLTVGDTRFDRVTDIAALARRLEIVESFTRDHRTIVAGSSWLPDEQLLASYINRHCSEGLRMVIAPHHVEPDRIKELRGLLTCRVALYTEAKNADSIDADVLIIDTIGLLSSVYQYGQTAYIGGGFGVGIHNTLEAAVWGLPVSFGPNYHKFKEAVELIECGAAISVSNQTELDRAFDRFMLNPELPAKAARQYVAAHTGASDVIYNQTI